MNKEIDVSVVVPVYNEQDSVEPLYNAIVTAMEQLNYTYEIVLVDDGSKDETFKRAEELAKKDPKLVVVKLKKNYGQTIGLHAGFHSAKGRMIITMDGDLQNDPTDIGPMLQGIENGNDIVLGWRYDRKDFFISRKLPSKIANGLIRKLTGIPVKDNGCAIRAYRGEVVQKIPMYSEMHRLMPVITALSGAKFTQVKVKHHPRIFGHSKYGLSRIYKVLIDMFALKVTFAFFNMPLYGFGLFAAFFTILASVFLMYGLVQYALYPEESLVTVMGASVLFGSLGAFMAFLGVISELAYKTGSIKIEKLLRHKRFGKFKFAEK